MKLLLCTILAILLVGLLALTGFAQDAPQGGRLPPATQSAAPPAQQQRPVGQAMVVGGDEPQAGIEEKTPEQRREETVAAIREETGLPAQRDTGRLSDDWFLPQSASETAPSTDGVLAYINIVTVFFTVLILALMIYFAIRYRSRSPDEPDPENVSTHSTTLELTWTVIPTCIVLIMFALGFRDFLHQTVSPPNAYRIDVLASMWTWQFTYPNGARTEDLHIPVDRPVQFYVTSQDVIHSFFIPAFRIKKDVVPGRFNHIWTEPTAVGVFDVFCTEYCGTNHSRMLAKCFVYPQNQYDSMLARISNIYVNFPDGSPRTPEQVGAALYAARGCIGCHTTDGSVRQAPTWKNLYGSTRTFLDGTTAVADHAYIRQSILQPAEHIVVGYGASMPSFAGQLDDRDINSIIAYLKTLSENVKQVQGSDETIKPGESQSLPPPETND